MRITALALWVSLLLACGGVEPADLSVVPFVDPDGNTVIAQPGYHYPSPGLLAADDAQVVMSVDYHGDAFVMSVPAKGGPVSWVQYPGYTVQALVLEGTTVWIGTRWGVMFSDRGQPFQKFGPFDLDVVALALDEKQVYVLGKHGLVAIDRSTQKDTLLQPTELTFSGGLLVQGEELVYSRGYGETAVVRDGAATPLAIDGDGPLTLWNGRLYAPHSIGSSIKHLDWGGSQASEIDCQTGGFAGFAFGEGAAWIGTARGVGGQIGEAGYKYKVPVFSHPGGEGGLYRCDLADGTTSANLSPTSERVTAVATSGSQVYFFDAERGYLLMRTWP